MAIPSPTHKNAKEARNLINIFSASNPQNGLVKTPGNAKTAVDIILGFYEAMGKKHKITEPDEIWKEMASTSPLFKGINYKRIEEEGGIQWPCPDENHPGTPYLHKDQMESGETGIFSPVDHIEPAEPTDKEFPFVLSTGRRRSTYHTGTQTGKARGCLLYTSPSPRDRG